MEQRREKMIDLLVETALPRPGTGLRLDSLTRKIVLLESYDNLMGIANHDDVFSAETNPFTICGAFKATDIFLNGVRHRLYREFALYNIGTRFNISLDEWMHQLPHQSMIQMEISKDIYEREQLLSDEISEEERKLRREQQRHTEGL